MEKESNENQKDSSNQCVELKNIKYKTMLINGLSSTETKSSNDLANLEKYLEDEKNNSKNEPWSKLDKTAKTKKFITFVEKYKEEKKLDDQESSQLLSFLKDGIDRKRLARVKDVIYDKISGEIKDIPALTYNKQNKNYTLKNIDKRVSTMKNLTPKKMVDSNSNSNSNIVNKQVGVGVGTIKVKNT